jgi:WD40 repeat protein
MTTIFSLTHPEELTDLRLLQISPDLLEIAFTDVNGVANTSQIAFNDQNTSSDQMQIDDSPTSNSLKLLSTLEISRDHLPLHVITLVQKQDLTLCALGGLGRYIQLLLRCASVSPQYYPLLSVPVPQPINTIQMIADEIRVQGQDQHWNVTMFFAGQDKNVYKYNVGIKKNDKSGIVDAAVTNKVTYKGHSDHVRGLTLNPTDQHSFVTVSDDGTVRQWQVENAVPTETFEAHSNDILAVDLKNGVIASGGKDRNIKLWSSATDKAIKTPVTVLQNISVVKTLWLTNDAQQVISGGGDGAVRVFKLTGTEHTKKGPVQNWGLAWEKKIHEDAISAMVVLELENERLLVTSSRDKTIKFTKIAK